MTKKQRALEIIGRLKEEYPDAGCTLDYDQAWKLLVSVRLAAQCTDARVNVVVEGLYEKYPDVNALAQADVDELEELFDTICVHSSREAFNMSALRRIGYILKAGYAIKESYGNMTTYMDTEIFSKDVVDLSAIDRRLRSLSSFVSALEKKRNALEFIETAPKILVSIRKVKETYGLGQEDIRQIQKMLIPYYRTPYFNAHSLWDEVKELPLIRQLQGNEWMLSCIMRQQESVFTQHFAGNMVLSLDSNNLSLGKVSLWFSSVYGKMPLNTFVAKFNDYFGCKIENYKFAEKLKSANLWDDIVTDSMDEYMDSFLDFSKMKEDDLFAEEFM